MTRPKHLDLFSGIGGFALAAEWAGFETVAFVEINPFCRSILGRHWPGVPVFQDVRKFYRLAMDMDECPECCDEPFCELCGDHFFECDCLGGGQWDDDFGEVDLITAGVPCQPSSLIGERRGTGDERWLWADAIRIIGRLRPRWALLENPTGLFSVDGGDAWARILAEFHALGFCCWWETVPACAVGARHRRDRVWLIVADAQGGQDDERESRELVRAAKGRQGSLDPARVGGSNLADPGGQGLEGHAGDEPGTERRQGASGGSTGAGGLRAGADPAGGWESCTGVRRVAHGVPGRVDRITALGNAIVPQVAYQFLKDFR